MKPEDFNFYHNVGNFCCSNWEQIAGRLPDPALVWGKFFCVKFKTELRQRVTDETPGTGDGGGSLHDFHQHGGGVELFSSEGNFSFQGGWVEEMFRS